MVCFGVKYVVFMLLVVGVWFMGEIVKIFSLEKIIFMFILVVECLLDLGCLIDEFSVFCDVYFDRIVVVYVNILVVVKVCVDWVVIFSIVVELIEYLDSLGEKIIWVLDRYLGNYV